MSKLVIGVLNRFPGYFMTSEFITFQLRSVAIWFLILFLVASQTWGVMRRIETLRLLHLFMHQATQCTR